MKFIESTSFFVRTIVFDFVHRSRDLSLKFKFVPMIHIGSKSYYNEVFQHLNQCDEILYELAMIPRGKGFNKSYKKLAQKLNLVTQEEAFDYKNLKPKMIHADYNRTSGKAAYSKLSWMEKIKFSYLKPLALKWYAKTITRHELAEAMRPSCESYSIAYGPLPDVEGTAENLIMRSRDNIILEAMKQKLQKESHLDKTVGIMYGASHLNYLSNYLTVKKGFIPSNAEFIKVFDVL